MVVVVVVEGVGKADTVLYIKGKAVVVVVVRRPASLPLQPSPGQLRHRGSFVLTLCVTVLVASWVNENKRKKKC